MYKHLKFFDKSGQSLNLEYNPDADTWSGTVYFDRVSAGLYENQHLFILEEVLTGSPDSTELVYPLLKNQNTPTSQTWSTRWANDADKDHIFTYLLDESDGNPYITRYETIEAANPTISYALSSPGDQKIPTSVRSEAMRFNIALTSFEEGIYDRTLQIYDNSTAEATLVATVSFHGETTGEDERFRLMLENFGRRFTESDARIIRDYDIKEALPNWEQINEKRKELFVAGEDIFPYIGSYKGLINAIRFFGYQDLRVKEYWLNIDTRSDYYGKIQMFEIQGLLDDEYSPRKKHPLIPSTSYRKTAKFGLFYDITRLTGDVDQFGTPITENAFMFTNEEVLIKLFALKEALKRDYMPLNARIVDIVGEGIYFNTYRVKTWTDDLQTFQVNINTRVDFDVEPRIGHIRDLREFQVRRFSPGLDLPVDRFTNEINPYTLGQRYETYAVPGLVESIRQFYSNLSEFVFPYTGEKSRFHGDEPGILAGMPIILKGNVVQYTWDDMTVSWDSMGPGFNWDNIDFNTFYEMEWMIEKPAPLPYSFSIRGKIEDLYEYPHFLPYAGKYTVTMRLHDVFNGYSTEVKSEFIHVMSREIELSAFCKFRTTDNYTWDTVDNTWDGLGGSQWRFPIEGEQPYESAMNEQLTNWPRYRNQDDTPVLNETTNNYEELLFSQNPNARRFGTRNLTWQNMDIPWDELYHSTWDMYSYNADYLGGFRIFSPSIGDAIQVGDYDPFVFADASPSNGTLTLQEAADALNASRNTGISKYTYTVRFFAGGSPALSFIHAEAKQPGPFGWDFITYIPSGLGTIYGDEVCWVKPTWLDWQFDGMTALYPSVAEESWFLDAPLSDILSGAAMTRQYWIDNGSIQTVPLSEQFYTQLMRRRGEIPSSYGSGAFNNSNLRLYKDDFEVPLGVPVFFTASHSEIPGRTGFRWVLSNEITGEKLLEIKDKPFFIWNFNEEGEYTMECWCTDTHGNESYVRRPGMVKVSSRKNIRKITERETVRI
jgi:hypothetical protein